MLSASIPNVMGKLQRMQEEYPVDVTLYNTRMTKLTSLVNILQQTDILVIDVSDILLNMIFLRTYSVIIVIDDQCERQEAFHRAYRKLSQELTIAVCRSYKPKCQSPSSWI